MRLPRVAGGARIPKGVRLPRVARGRVPSIHDVTWLRGLETLLFALPPVLGVGIVGVLEGVVPGPIRFALLGFGTVGYLVIRVGVPLCCYFDARELASAPTDWHPRPWLYLLTAAAVSPSLVGVIYLHRRHRHVETRSALPVWRYVVWISLVVPLSGLAVAVLGIAFATPSVVATGLALAGAVALGVFPASIYKDAAYVRTRSVAWRPNPGTYLGLAFASIVFAPFQPVVASYYLVRRRSAGL